MKNSKRRVQKMITFPEAMYRILEKRAESVGINTPEYIRYLVLDDIRSGDYDTEAINKAVAEAEEEYRLGKTRTIKTKGELKEYMDELEEYAKTTK